jgi:biotin operon repressor
MARRSKRRGGGASLMPSANPIASAIAALETERAHLQARLAKVEEAIATMRELFHLPGARRKTAPANGNGHDRDTAAKIRAALTAGPMAPGALAAELGVTRAALRYYVQALEQQGVVISKGTTVSRRIALAGHPAKEAP